MRLATRFAPLLVAAAFAAPATMPAAHAAQPPALTHSIDGSGFDVFQADTAPATSGDVEVLRGTALHITSTAVGTGFLFKITQGTTSYQSIGMVGHYVILVPASAPPGAYAISRVGGTLSTSSPVTQVVVVV